MLVFGFFLNFFKKFLENFTVYLFFLFGRVGYIEPYCAVCQYFFCVPFDCHPSEIIGKGDEICRPSFLGRATEPTPNHYINQKLVLNLPLSDVNCELRALAIESQVTVTARTRAHENPKCYRPLYEIAARSAAKNLFGYLFQQKCL